MSVSLPSPPNRLRGGQRAVGFVERDHVIAALAEHLDQEVFATVGVPPVTVTAPPLTRIVPGGVAADDDRVVEVVADHGQRAGAWEKLAVIAIVVVLQC